MLGFEDVVDEKLEQRLQRDAPYGDNGQGGKTEREPGMCFDQINDAQNSRAPNSRLRRQGQRLGQDREGNGTDGKADKGLSIISDCADM